MRVIAIMAFDPYRSPAVAPGGRAASSAAMSAAVSASSAAGALSSSVTRRFEPGMGTMLSPYASSQASATCAGVALCAAATCLTMATAAMLAS